MLLFEGDLPLILGRSYRSWMLRTSQALRVGSSGSCALCGANTQVYGSGLCARRERRNPTNYQSMLQRLYTRYMTQSRLLF
jgi:hypothetical protein